MLQSDVSHGIPLHIGRHHFLKRHPSGSHYGLSQLLLQLGASDTPIPPLDLSRFISASLSRFGGYLFELSGRY
ncbi:hypothetical protein, partial [Ochrobactrum sp. SFR4]|uniref:hypothetical protein n=1 Tax=Ochrobactrum sp. SFR4 TaxID=2717368 RepID=UPI001C8CCA97